MKRRLLSCSTAESNPSPLQKFIHGEAENAVKATISHLKRETASFREIADLIGFSHEYVRQRLVNDPNVIRAGKRYRVPRATAARFIAELLMSR
jgi:hypothetical protein